MLRAFKMMLISARTGQKRSAWVSICPHVSRAQLGNIGNIKRQMRNL